LAAPISVNQKDRASRRRFPRRRLRRIAPEPARCALVEIFEAAGGGGSFAKLLGSFSAWG